MPAAKRPGSPQAVLDALERLGGRLDGLEAAQAEIQSQLAAVQGLGAELVRCDELARTAAVRAQDAHTMAQLVSSFDARLNSLTLAVAEGIQNVTRAENRVKATIQRARKDLQNAGLEPSPGLEAEADEAGLVDVGGSESGTVHPVRSEVGPDPDEVVILPGIPGRVRRGFLQAMAG